MTFGENLQQLRKSVGLSQEQLAQVINVSRQAISKWETDQSLPDIDKLLILCKTFSVPADELIGISTVAKESEKENFYSLKNATHSNITKRYITIGFTAFLVGVVLLVFEFLSLYLLQYADTIIHSSNYTNALQYAQKPPMSIVIGITLGLIAVGIVISIYGFLLGNSQK